MTKRTRIIYWIATAWLALGMFSTGLVQLLRSESEVAVMTGLGYPSYLLTILGVWKILGVVVLLMPGLQLVKEWAYAGFFFAMSGAIISHFASGDPAIDAAPSLLLLALTVLSWYFRPPHRRLSPVSGGSAAASSR